MAPSPAVTITVMGNVAPVVSISVTNPTNGSVLTAPPSFTVQDFASDADGSVSQVEFFKGAESLGVDSNSGYSIAVSGLASGRYALAVFATANLVAKSTNSVGI